MAERGDDTGQYASPPCFMHELWADDCDLPEPVSKQQRIDVARWRKAERARRISARMALSPEQRSDHDKRISGYLKELIGDVSAQVVSAYWPCRAEPDLRQLMTVLAREGAHTALPVAVERGCPLVFRLWKAGERMEKDAWNIPVPADGDEVVPDVVIAPLVGFDRENHRLGYGSGSFDRTLAGMARRPRLFGVGYHLAFIPTIYPQPHDIAMETIITERGEMRSESCV